MTKKMAMILLVMGLCVFTGMAADYLVVPRGASNWKNLSSWIDNRSGSYVESSYLPGAEDNVTVHGNRSLYISDEREARGLTCGMNGFLGNLYLHKPASSLMLTALSVGGNSGDGIVEQSDGRVAVAKRLIVGGKSTEGAYNLSGGTLEMGAGSAITLGAGGTMSVDGGTVKTTATPKYAAIDGPGKFELLSGDIHVAGGSVQDLFALNTALMEVSGGTLAVDAQLRLGNSKANDTEFVVIGDAATINMLAINNKEAAMSMHGTFRFVLGKEGVSGIHVQEWMFLSGSKLVVDGTAYSGGEQTLTLFRAADGLLDTIAEDNIFLIGFDEALAASIEQDADGFVALNIR